MEVIALLLGAFFIPLAFFVFIKCLQGDSSALILYFVALSVVLATNFINRDITDTSINLQVLLKFIFILGGFVVGVFHLYIGKVKFYKSSIYILAFSILCVVSSFYSPVKIYTFVSGFSMLSFVLFSSVLVVYVKEDELLYTMIVSLSIPIFVALVGYLVAPEVVMLVTDTGHTLRLAGLIGSPNGLARVAMLLLLTIVAVYAANYSQPKWWWFVLILMAFYVIMLTQTRSVVLAMVLAISVVFWKQLIAYLASFSIFSLCFIILFIVFGALPGLDSILSAVSRSGRIEEVITLTGRTEIWMSAIELWMEEPLLGYGLGASKEIIIYENSWGWIANTAHNLFLQTLFSLGVVGFVLLMKILFYQFKLFNFRVSYVHSLFFVFFMVVGFFEAGVLAVTPDLFTLLWVLTILMASNKKREMIVR